MATLGGVRRSLVLVALAVLLVVPVVAQERSEKEEAMEKIEGLMEAGDWKAAVKALKSYDRKFAETEEEKAEVQELSSLAEGQLELEKVETEYRKKQKPRSTVRKLAKILEKYAEASAVAEKAEQLMEVIRSEYVLVIEDFEDWDDDDDDEDGGGSRRRILVDDPKLVKHGDWSLRWKAGRGSGWWSIESPQLDWSGYDYFCIWIFNEKREKRPGRIEIEARSGFDHYFQFYLAIDWVGWREFRIPLRGKKSKFARHGNPAWDSIEQIDFDHFDDVGTPVNIIIDDIRLEKHVK